MAKKKNIPDIRFKDFSDEWEECELSQLVDLQSGRDYKHLSNGHIPVYGTGGYMLSVNEALSYKEDAVGIGRKGTIDKPYILNAPFWTVDTLFYSLPKEKNNLNFIYDIFQKINWRQKDESTGVPSLSKVAINGIKTFTTTPSEQTKIGNYLKKLDQLITQHQQKYNKLLTIKKAMLKKMFPQNGANVPEIRFNGFSEDWEEKSLIDMAEISTGYPFDSNCFNDNGDFLVITNGNIQNDSYSVDNSIGNRIDIKNNSKLTEYVLNINDILVTMDGTVGRTAKVLEQKQILAQRVGRLTAKLDAEFLYQFLNTGKFFKEMSLVSHGGTIKHISLTEIGDYKDFMPKSIEEQKRIGSYFAYIDTVTILYQSKLEKLKNIKKAFLDKMFV